MKHAPLTIESLASIKARTCTSSVVRRLILDEKTDDYSKSLNPEYLGWPRHDFRFPVILGPIVEYRGVGWPEEVIDLAYESNKRVIDLDFPVQRGEV